jgi:hypothetical protein
MELVEVALVLLASARVTILFVYDDIMAGFRDAVFHLSPPEDEPDRGFFYQHYWVTLDKRKRRENKRHGMGIIARRYQFQNELRAPGFWGRALACPDCFGVWVGFAATILYLLFPEETVVVSLAFAASMVTSWITRKARFQ